MSDKEFMEMLDETSDPITVFGITFYAGQVLRELDPIAFSVFKSDYIANLEKDTLTA
jgi:hypothetical protein